MRSGQPEVTAPHLDQAALLSGIQRDLDLGGVGGHEQLGRPRFCGDESPVGILADLPATGLDGCLARGPGVGGCEVDRDLGLVACHYTPLWLSGQKHAIGDADAIRFPHEPQNEVASIRTAPQNEENLTSAVDGSS
jgi:hypothetical protein